MDVLTTSTVHGACLSNKEHFCPSQLQQLTKLSGGIVRWVLTGCLSNTHPVRIPLYIGL